MDKIWYGILYLPLMTTIVASEQSNRTDELDCYSLLKIDDQLYFTLKERTPVDGIPTDFNINWWTNDLFFTIVTNHAEMQVLILLNNSVGTLGADKRFHVIKTPGVSQTSAVDNRNNIIYIGTDSGVYTYNYYDKITLHSAHGEDVMYLAVNEDGSEIYIATFPNNQVSKITSHRRLEKLPMIRNGHGLKIYKDYIFYYSADAKTPCLYNKEHSYSKKIDNIRDLRNVFFYVTTTGQIQAMDIKSNIYYINPENATAEFMGTFNIDKVSAFGLDSLNNVYIGTDKEILMFQAFKHNPCKGLNKISYKLN